MAPLKRFLTLVSAACALSAGVAPLSAQEAGEGLVRTGTLAGQAAPRLQPGDQIGLRIVREPEMSGTFAVSEEGEVVLPRLGRIAVSEMGVEALEDSLRSAYSVYLRDPVIEVTVLRRIAVHGEVYRPNIYMADLTVTLRDLIAMAGGVTQAGNPRDIVIVRGVERIRVNRGADAGFTAAELRSGDQVVVGRRSWIAMNPAVALSTATGLISFIITTALLVK